MEIVIPTDTAEKLTEVAVAAGYADASALIDAIAREPTTDPCGPLGRDELAASAADCVRINERMKAGAGHDAREALSKLGEKFGFPTPQ